MKSLTKRIWGQALQLSIQPNIALKQDGRYRAHPLALRWASQINCARRCKDEGELFMWRCRV
jgi:hypothetical protein